MYIFFRIRKNGSSSKLIQQSQYIFRVFERREYCEKIKFDDNELLNVLFIQHIP